MTLAQDHWAEAADRITALALKLKLHTEEELSVAGVSLTEIGESIGKAVSSAAEALADACQDGAIRQDLRDAGAAISDAVRASLHSARPAAHSDD